MTSRGIGEDLNSVKTHIDMRSTGDMSNTSGDQGRTDDAGVNSSSHSSTPMTVSSDDTVSKWHTRLSEFNTRYSDFETHLACNPPNHAWQGMLLNLAMLMPWRKVAEFSLTPVSAI